jgi:hypothetical protein
VQDRRARLARTVPVAAHGPVFDGARPVVDLPIVPRPPRDPFEEHIVHPDVHDAVKRVLRRYGFVAIDLDEDGPQEVKRLALAWKKRPRPTTLEGTKRVCICIAYRVGASVYRMGKLRAEAGYAGTTDIIEERFALYDVNFDTIDRAELLAALRKVLPDEAIESLDDVASGTPQRETAQERGVSYAQHRKDVEKWRKLSRAALGVGSLAAFLAGIWFLWVRGASDPGVASPAPEESVEPSSTSTGTSTAPDTRSMPAATAPERNRDAAPPPKLTPKEQAAESRKRAFAACAEEDWQGCLNVFGDAKEIDPKGAEAPEVKAMVAKAKRELLAQKRDR